MEKISIIIPFYNIGEILRDSVNAALSQDYDNIELILVDDGSTDNSFDIALEFEKKDPSIKIVQKPNGGPGEARNAGLMEAEGEFITFMDSDDVVTRDFVSSMRRLIDPENGIYHSMTGLTFCDMSFEVPPLPTEQGSTLRMSPQDYASNMTAEKITSSVVNRLYVRRLIEDNGIRFHTDHGFWEDMKFNLDYIKATGTDTIYDQTVRYFARRHENSTTRGGTKDHDDEWVESIASLYDFVNNDPFWSAGVKKNMENMYGAAMINLIEKKKKLLNLS
jgi:glycosyltransferase involved in cell wall biosynthesis